MSRRLRLFPLNSVLFPGAVLNLHVFEPRYKQMINECLESGEGFGVALIAEGAEAGDPNVLPHNVGSIAEILDVQPLPFGRFFVSTVGRTRFRIREVVSREPYLIADVDVIEEPEQKADREVDELLPAVRERFEEYIEMLVEFSGQESRVALPRRSAWYFVPDRRHASGCRARQAASARTFRHQSAPARRVRLPRASAPAAAPPLGNRRVELREREENGEDDSSRAEQERYFGKFFSQN